MRAGKKKRFRDLQKKEKKRRRGKKSLKPGPESNILSLSDAFCAPATHRAGV